jgi:Ca2+-binding EF-hand superfamily protein
MKNLFKTIKLGFLVAGSLSVITTALIAEDLPNRGPIEFSSYDTNKDGFISEKEFNNVKAKRIAQKATSGMPMKNVANAPDFSALDANKDGKLTEIELLKGQNKQMQNNQKNMGMGQGMNGQGMNGQMGKGYNMPNFEDFDVNKDGVISAKEMDEAREKRMEQKSSEGKMMKNIGNQPMFSDIDTNKDGNVSKEEFLNHQMKQRP